MPELILVRHARTAWSGRRYCGRSDPPLDMRGLAAADRLGAELASTLPRAARILSSPRRRAIQTAEAIALHSRASRVDIDDRWAEVDFGIAEGLTFEQLERLAPGIAVALAAGDVEIDWPGGETSAAFTSRVEGAWYDLVMRLETTVVVAHGGPLRVAIGLATGRSAALVAVPDPAGVARFELPLQGEPTPLASTA